MSKPTVIFILGMHRSGTSALAGLFAKSGIWLGDDLLEPVPGINDKGFWEHKELVRINEALLAEAGIKWFSPLGSAEFASFCASSKTSLSKLRSAALAFAQSLLKGEKGNGTRCVAIKDPRLCLTAVFWKSVFEEAGADVAGIQLLRHPTEVSASLKKRDSIVASHSNILWLDYVLTASDFCKELDRSFTGTFDKLMASPTELASEALNALGVEAEDEMIAGWVDSGLRHHQSRNNQVDGLLGDTAVTVYNEIITQQKNEKFTLRDIDKKTREFLPDMEEQFVNYNNVIINYEKSSAKAKELGASLEYAQQVVVERDKQLTDLNVKLKQIGDKHSHALKVIRERDTQQLEMNKEIEALAQQVQELQTSLPGKVVKLWRSFSTLVSSKPYYPSSGEVIKPFVGETKFPNSGNRPPVDVIIPVYAGFEETKAAVETASASLDRSWSRLIIINDSSPELAITQWLRDNQKNFNYELLENDQNLGFVGTVNRGMRLHPEADVLLLNSDVEVANDWLERLQNCAYSRTKVASVSATANNATICSFPIFCQDNELALSLDLSEIDQCFRRVVPEGTTVEIPSAIGCCMYIRRDALDDLGLFDVEAFGRGYGEENDWSQRAIKKGWVNLHSLNVFVYHKGGVSFAAESDPRKQANLEIVNRRHPNYASDVQSFIADDPAAAWRIRVLINLLGELDRPKSLAISHGLGGGVKSHILELGRKIQDVQFLHLEPLGGDVVRLEFLPGEQGGAYLDFRIPQEYSTLLDILKGCGVSHVHFHHTMRLPTRLWGLGDDLDCPIDYTLHDYWVLNGNPTQTDDTGCYVGSGPDADELCQSAYPLPHGVTPQRWRENQLPLMEKARYLICPSVDTMQRISSADEFRKLDQWVVTPHLDHTDVAEVVRSERERKGPLKVVALGALSREKGADLLESAATALKGEAIEFHLLGYAYRELDSAVITHGPYPERECEQRLLALDPDVVWYTARWPETYSYTLSAALRTGLPVVAPGIGAFPERLAGRQATIVVDYFEDPGYWPEFWRKVANDNARELLASRAPVISVDSVDTGFYQTAYLASLSVQQGRLELSDESLIDLLTQTHHDDEARGRRERLLGVLIKLRQAKGLSWLVRLIPFRYQRAVKRFLSREPMHEL